jgi:hypothetical protein
MKRITYNVVRITGSYRSEAAPVIRYTNPVIQKPEVSRG